MSEANSEQQVDHCPSNSTLDSTSAIKRKVSRVLSSCRICLSSVFDPAYLSCGHRFCEKCLNTYWHVKEKPDYIVCPLCRACANNIAFVEKEESSSTEDLRKTFNMSDKARFDMDSTSFLCFKISILIPLIYFLVKWLRSPLMDFLGYSQVEA